VLKKTDCQGVSVARLSEPRRPASGETFANRRSFGWSMRGLWVPTLRSGKTNARQLHRRPAPSNQHPAQPTSFAEHQGLTVGRRALSRIPFHVHRGRKAGQMIAHLARVRIRCSQDVRILGGNLMPEVSASPHRKQPTTGLSQAHDARVTIRRRCAPRGQPHSARGDLILAFADQEMVRIGQNRTSLGSAIFLICRRTD